MPGAHAIIRDHMDIWLQLGLAAAAFAAGAINAVAGGGTFLTFPMLVFAGVPPVQANATSTVALFPGSFSAMAAYRKDIGQLKGVIHISSFFGISLVGGLLGALLLLWTPQEVFQWIIPWLLLFATLLFAFGKPVSAWISRRYTMTAGPLLAVQFVVSIYGGYFGGGIGILMLASLGLFGLKDLHAMNGLKTMVVGSLNAVATVTFVAAGAVEWLAVAVMLPAAVAGGYGGAALARRVPQPVLRAFILAVASAMTGYFFLEG